MNRKQLKEWQDAKAAATKAQWEKEIASTTPEAMAAEFNAAEAKGCLNTRLATMLTTQIATGRKYLSLSESSPEQRAEHMLCVLGALRDVRSLLSMAESK